MKTALKILMLSPLILSTGACGNNDKKDPIPVDVIVISGQSNAVGCTHVNCITRSIGHSKYQEYMEGYPGIQIAFDSWTKEVKQDKTLFYSQNESRKETFMKTMLGQGNGQGTFGPEIGIAESMYEKYSDKLFLIKYACGASNLKDDWAQKDSPMYPRLIKYVKKQIKNLEDMGYIPTIKAFCWMQGEGDAWEGYYQHYFDNLSLFVSNIREDLLELSGNVELPFIDAGISNSRDWQYYREVNEAKRQFAELSDNNIYIDTIAAGLHTNQEPFSDPDTAHYDTESEVELGRLFAENFEQFLTPINEEK